MLFGAVAFLPYLFAMGVPFSQEPLPIPSAVEWAVGNILSAPRDIWDWLIYLAYPENENIWYRNWLNAGLATVLMHFRAFLTESARRNMKLTGFAFNVPFAFLLWPVFIGLMLREYFVFNSRAKQRDEVFDSVPYLIFIEAPAYAIGFTVLCAGVGAMFPTLV